ncbi:MAG: GIY-YIG nuclease family protein [Arenimonas sp.]
MATPWYLYLIECTDGSLYTGIAVDVGKRYSLHVSGKGAKYTRSHPPLRLAAIIACDDRGAASRAEYHVKKLSAHAKRELCLRHPPRQCNMLASTEAQPPCAPYPGPSE